MFDIRFYGLVFGFAVLVLLFIIILVKKIKTLRLVAILLMIVALIGLSFSLTYYFLSRTESTNNISYSQQVLYKINENGKWGYINNKGKVIIQPQYDNARDFHEGLAYVTVGDSWQFIDASGKVIIKQPFTDYGVFDFCEDYAVVLKNSRTEKPKYGYMNKKGEIVIPTIYNEAYSFNDGIARVKQDSGYAFIDKTGNKVINNYYFIANDFHEGLASVCFYSGKKLLSGYIDKTGKFSILFNDDKSLGSDFNEGIAVVSISDGDSKVRKEGLLNKLGKFITEPKDISINRFSEGLAKFSITKYEDIKGYDTKQYVYYYGYMNKEGAVVIDAKFKAAADFSEGLAAVNVDGKFGYINTKGEFVINPQFDYAEKYNNGLAEVKIGNKIGYIDKTGSFIWSSEVSLSSSPGNSKNINNGNNNTSTNNISSNITNNQSNKITKEKALELLNALPKNDNLLKTTYNIFSQKETQLKLPSEEKYYIFLPTYYEKDGTSVNGDVLYCVDKYDGKIYKFSSADGLKQIK